MSTTRDVSLCNRCMVGEAFRNPSGDLCARQ